MGYSAPFYRLVILLKHVMSDTIEIRRVQAYRGERSLTIVLPKIFSEKLGIENGDFLKVLLEKNRLILEKADL